MIGKTPGSEYSDRLIKYKQVTTGWSKETCLLTDFTFIHIYIYQAESKGKTFDSNSIKTFKSLKVFTYFTDGFVQDTSLYYFGSGKKIVYIRAHISACMKVSV